MFARITGRSIIQLDVSVVVMGLPAATAGDHRHTYSEHMKGAHYVATDTVSRIEAVTKLYL